MNKILITGANGFVGSHLVDYLLARGYHVTGSVRTLDKQLDIESENLHWIQTGEISPDTKWDYILKNVDVVVHLAQRAHRMNETESSSGDLYRNVNVNGLKNLAESGVRAGVKQFVFLSSIKVNGEISSRPFREEDIPNPVDPYAISKLEAESELKKICCKGEMAYTIIRPPLIYGKGVPANFMALVGLINSAIPLPLGAIDNMRSLLGVTNLCDFIATCIHKKEALNETFLISDDSDLSTTELVQLIRSNLSKKSLLLPLPSFILRILFSLAGKSSFTSRLLDSLQIDISKAKSRLGWQPPFPVEYDIKNSIQ